VKTFVDPALAYFLNDDWRTLQVVFSAPAVVFVSYWWLMPESVRWLIRKGRHEEAREEDGINWILSGF
jgi:OCT family organic cation transporter-like MFS transporter 4/5